MFPTPARIGLVLLLTALASCDDGSKDDTSVSACDMPVADAGEDQVVNWGSAVNLSGSGSTPCAGSTPTYTWTFKSVPTRSSVDDSALSANGTPDAVSTNFSPDAVGDFVLGLTLTADGVTSAEDVVVITVESSDLPPIADCGDSTTGVVGERASLDGSESYDPEGAAIEYSWALSSSPDCSALGTSDVFDSTESVATVVPDCEGTYVMSLVVTDLVQWSDPAYCSIEVTGGNNIPVADAGASEDLSACTDNPLQLNGFGSYDLDGDELSYQWGLLAAPDASGTSDDSFNDRTLPDPYFAWDVAGTYVFQLQVYDGQDYSPPDIVSYTIAESYENEPPVSNAGDDQTVALTAPCSSASYVWTCEDCEATSVELDGSGSYDPDGDSLGYSWSESTGTMSFSSGHSVITDGIIPAMPADYGVSSETVFEVTLSVSDCAEVGSDIMEITYTCTGENEY